MGIPEIEESIRPVEHPLMVMLVDDQSFAAELQQRQLTNEKDINFHYCQDPSQAISTAEKIGPTVVLLDFTMPGIDGLTLCHFFRDHPATRDIPIIMLSSNDDPVTKAPAFGAGANDYLVKLPDSTVSPYVTISLGVTTIVPEANSAPDVCVKLVDEALYRAKNEGQNRISIAIPPNAATGG